MCTGAEIAMLMAASTAVSVIGTVASGQQQKAMYKAQSQQAQNEAAYAADAAKAQAEKIRRMGRIQRSETSAALAGAGVKLGEGTALEIDKDITERVEEDAFATILSGRRALQAGDAQSSLLRTAGNNAERNSYMQAGATVLQAGATFGKAGWKSNLADSYNGTWTADGSFDSRTYGKQIWD